MVIMRLEPFLIVTHYARSEATSGRLLVIGQVTRVLRRT